MTSSTVADLLDDRWGLTGVVLTERLQTFPTRFVERIESDQGPFAVKVDEHPGTMVQGSESVQLAAASVLPRHVAGIRPGRFGELVAADDGRRIVVHEDIRGGQPEATAETWRALGRILARLHMITISVRPYAIPLVGVAEELEQQAGDYPFASQFRPLVARVRSIRDQPAAIIHGEVNLSNARRRSNGDLVLLDWDSAGVGPVAVDLGYPLICALHDEDLIWHADHAAAFYRAYATTSLAGSPAPQQIFDAGVMHALRYLRFGSTERRWARLQNVLERERIVVEFLRRILDH